MKLDRRALLQSSITGLGLVGASRALASEPTTRFSDEGGGATLMTMVFLSKRLDASTADYRRWYIEQHSLDYLSFASQYLERYTQHFVEKARMGDVDFDAISEFSFPSRHALNENLRVVDLPENRAILASHPKIGVKPGPNEAHNGPRRFSIDTRLLAGPVRGYDKPGSVKLGVLFKRPRAVAPEDFVHKLINYGSAIARDSNGAVERMVLNAAVPEVGRPFPLYDAVILVWPRPGADLGPAFATPPKEVELVNILDLLSYEPNLKAF